MSSVHARVLRVISIITAAFTRCAGMEDDDEIDAMLSQVRSRSLLTALFVHACAGWRWLAMLAAAAGACLYALP
jgi:hypothetical protein